MNNNYSNLIVQVVVLVCLGLWVGFEARGQNISSVAGTGHGGYNGDEKIATTAELHGFAGGVFDDHGNMYIADYYGQRIRKIDKEGIIHTIAGMGRPGFGGDGGPATEAKLFGPCSVALDKQNNLYFCDNYNQRVRKINLADGTISTIAGTGSGGFNGNGGPAIVAQVQSPMGIAVDQSGNVYFSDCDNNCIRKINTQGIISNYAGNAYGHGTGGGGFWGDGKAAANAELNHPKGLAIDAGGNLYFADCFNHRIRKVSSNGIISTVAGEGASGFLGDEGAAINALLNYPNDVAVDRQGNLFICDHTNNRIRVVNNHGIITTIAGTGDKGFSGDGGPAKKALLANPSFVTVAPDGNLYIGDNDNERIRMVDLNMPNASNHSVSPIIKMPALTGHATSN